VIGSNDKVRFDDWYAESAATIDKFETSDVHYPVQSQLNQLVSATAAFQPSQGDRAEIQGGQLGPSGTIWLTPELSEKETVTISIRAGVPYALQLGPAANRAELCKGGSGPNYHHEFVGCASLRPNASRSGR
jgi:hypothetical protein